MKKKFYLILVSFVVLLSSCNCKKSDCDKQSDDACCKKEAVAEKTGKEVKVVVTMKLKADKQEQFLAAFRKMADETRKEKGCIYYDLHQDAKDSLAYVLLENWATQEDLDAHGQTEHMKVYREEAADTRESGSAYFVKQVY